MKKILSALLTAVFVFGSFGVFAEEETVALETGSAETEAETEENEAVGNTDVKEARTYTLSLEEAKKLAYEDNMQLSTVELKKQSYDLSLTSAKLNKGKYKNAEVHVSSSTAGLLIKKGYYVELYEVQKALAEKELEKVKAQIDYDVTEKYYNYKLTERLIEVCRTSYELANTNLDSVNKMFELGLAAQIDVDSARAVCEQARAAVESYERALDLAGEDLKIILNIDGNASFILTDNIDYSEFESDVEGDIEEAMKSRYDIQSLNESSRLAELNYSILKTALTDRTAETLSAKSSYVQAVYTADNSSKLIKLGIRSAYNNIISSQSDMDIAKLNTEINTQKYNAAQLKYEMGMMTNSELTTILNDLRTSEISYEQARLAHKLAVEKYGYEITIGL